MGCCSCLGQYLLFFVNLGFALVGIAIVVVGALYKYQFDQILEVLPDDVSVLSITPTLAIVVGSIVFVIAFFGCCGAIKQGTCLLTTYAVFVFVILILQVALGIYAFVQFGNGRNDLREHIFNQMNNTFHNYPNSNSVREAVDFLQSELSCCGINGMGDWATITTSLPSSCCSSSPATCSQAAAFTTGCGDALWSWLQRNANTIGIVAIVIGAAELIGGIIAVCQIKSIKRRYHV